MGNLRRWYQVLPQNRFPRRRRTPCRWHLRMSSFFRSYSMKSVAISGWLNVSLMRTVLMVLNSTIRSCSIDCVLISIVFWRSCRLRRYFFASLMYQAGFGDGYTPTPTLTTRMSS